MSTEAGPLSITLNTSAAVTAIPLIADKSWCQVRYTGVKQKHLEDKGDVLDFNFELVSEATDTNGKPLKPGGFGSKLFHSVYLYDKNTTPPAIPERAMAAIGEIQDAFCGTGDAGNAKGRPTRPNFTDPGVEPSMHGLTCWVEVRVKTGNYKGNEIKSFKNNADMNLPQT